MHLVNFIAQSVRLGHVVVFIGALRSNILLLHDDLVRSQILVETVENELFDTIIFLGVDSHLLHFVAVYIVLDELAIRLVLIEEAQLAMAIVAVQLALESLGHALIELALLDEHDPILTR